MAVGYNMVLWNRNKKIYDLFLGLGVVLYLVTFMVVSILTAEPGHEISPPIMAIRALGTCAFLMLTIILSIGPLARLNTVFLPLLYNRRHFGVVTFFIALFHFVIALGWYHGFGVLSPLVSLFATSADYSTTAVIPFEVFGFFALIVLFVMAATSHDFWLANLSPPLWKALHMFVYVAYAALCVHIALGILQDEVSMTYWALLAGSVIWVGGLHLITSTSRAFADRVSPVIDEEWIEVGPIDSIANNRAKIIHRPEDSIAVFRYDGKIAAVSNVCAHQNGPLGEGRVVDGCITCPWHGYQYLPESGQSPPPYQEKIATYRVGIQDGIVWVNAKANPPGTPEAPAVIPASPNGA